MTGCESYRDLLSAGLDGRLTPGEQDALRRHMETCAECRSLLDLYAELAEEELTVPVPDTMVSGAMARIAKEPRRNYKRWIGLAAGAVACVALVTLALPKTLKLGLSKGDRPMTAAATDAKTENALATYSFEEPAAEGETTEAAAAPAAGWAAEPEPEADAELFAEETMEEPLGDGWGEESQLDCGGSVYDPEAWREDPVLSEYYGEIVCYGTLPEKVNNLGPQHLKTEDGYDWYTLPVDAENALAELMEEYGAYCWFSGNPDAENLVILAEITQ
ncbi:MAG: zf-HC2 domain-containing protein [Oscillospiraceae bacterium]|nr:zf-HC2 domain-containing protein [Oscillospiraceae bacterium]